MKGIKLLILYGSLFATLLVFTGNITAAEIYFEAESAIEVTKQITIESDKNAFGEEYLNVPLWGDAKSKGKALYEFKVVIAGTYYMWIRIIGTWDHSMFIQINDGQEGIWDLLWGEEVREEWTWDPVSFRGGEDPMPFNLKTGKHILHFTHREGGKFDAFYLSDDKNAILPKEPIASTEAVSPKEKLTTTWASIKQ